MPKASKATASDAVQVEGYEGHFENFDGGYTVGFETYTADADMGELFKGLPDDRCQCEHWGYVIKGKLKITYTDGSEEIINAGEAYYLRPGHVGESLEETQTVEFSPTAEWQRTMEQIGKNLEEMGRS